MTKNQNSYSVIFTVQCKESFTYKELRHFILFSFPNYVFIEPEHDEVSWQCSNNGDFDACELMSF